MTNSGKKAEITTPYNAKLRNKTLKPALKWNF